MTRELIVGAVIASSVAPLTERGLRSAESVPQAPASQHAECSHLTMLKFPDVKVTAAAAVAASPSGPVRAAHCRVDGVIGTDIKFQLLLPDDWNHKFLMGGGGGYVAGVDNQYRMVVNAGYATVGTDTGHQGFVTDASWALDNWERQINFGYLAVHRTAEVAKAIVRSYYGAAEAHDYFAGCSNGGREALMEAQRYPDDFDGIVSGAPALDFVGIAAQFVKDIQAAFPDGKTPLFTADAIKSVGTQVLEKCDAIDGVKDGVLDDPRKCSVDVASLAGLTDAQKTALKKIYAPTGPADHPIYPAQPFGGETEMAGWPSWITGGSPMQMPQGPSLRYAFGTQFFKYFVFGDPSWDFTKYDVSNAPRDGKRVAAILNSNNPDLAAFKAKGRRLILWHGWADAGLTPLATVQYYEAIKARDAAAGDYSRLFMMPGVLHCGGGPGPDTVDWAAAIDAWVGGKAPDRLVARKLEKEQVVRSRPLCAYPQHAVFSGSGSTDDEKNFVCR